MSKEGKGDENELARRALDRLSLALKELDDKGNAFERKKDEEVVAEKDGKRGLKLCHWRNMTEEVESAYKMMSEGAELIKGTSTKFTITSKIDYHEGSKLSKDLQRGCEVLAAGVLVLHDKSVGCSRSVRCRAKSAGLSVVTAVKSLIQWRMETTAAAAVSDSATAEDEGPRRTGVVWDACDIVLGTVENKAAMKSVMPRGNRVAMRRDLLSWAADCNETFQEFTDLINLGPAPPADEQQPDDDDNEDDEEDMFEVDEQYTSAELAFITPCVGLVKSSKGAIGLALKACECAGDCVTTMEKQNPALLVKTAASDQYRQRRSVILQWMSDLHEQARVIGEGVTDFGVLLYPPLNLQQLQQQQGENEESTAALKSLELGRHALLQQRAINFICDFVLDATPTFIEDNDENGVDVLTVIPMSEEVVEMASKVRAAASSHIQQASSALLFSGK